MKTAGASAHWVKLVAMAIAVAIIALFGSYFGDEVGDSGSGYVVESPLPR